jgi:glycosyltransferase involved in cell wall biosynthesis
VLHVVTAAQRRGAELLAEELSEALGQSGWSSTVAALTPGTHETATPTLGSRALGATTLLRLRSLMRSASVVVAHGSRSLPACAIGGFGVRVPFVYRSIGDPRFWATSAPKRTVTGALMRRAARVIALTDEAAVVLAARYRVPPDRIVVIPKAIDAARFPGITPERRREARRALDIADDTKVALYLGSLSDEKNPAMAIAALRLVPDVHLVVAGLGPQRSSLCDLARSTAPGRVRFMGSVAEPVNIIAAADVLVLPSRTEGLPGVAIEAGMVGIPVVATDVGWVREIVIDGVTGVVVRPDDVDAFAAGISTALASATSFGRAGQSHCRAHFDMSDVADEWDKLLTEVTSGTAT